MPQATGRHQTSRRGAGDARVPVCPFARGTAGADAWCPPLISTVRERVGSVLGYLLADLSGRTADHASVHAAVRIRLPLDRRERRWVWQDGTGLWDEVPCDLRRPFVA